MKKNIPSELRTFASSKGIGQSCKAPEQEVKKNSTPFEHLLEMNETLRITFTRSRVAQM